MYFNTEFSTIKANKKVLVERVQTALPFNLTLAKSYERNTLSNHKLSYRDIPQRN